MNKVGVFLEAGGNKAFFVCGVLKKFCEKNIKVNHLIGLSSSSSILFTHCFKCHDEMLEIFANKLKKNKKNFYFLDEHFPQSNIYESSIRYMFKYYDKKKIDMDYTIIASHCSKKLKKTKGIFATITMAFENKKFSYIKIFDKVFDVKSFVVDSSMKLDNESLINIIMGSSTIYPAIKLHEYNNELILEGNLARINQKQMLKNFDKKIIIHTDKGKTKVEDDILHIYSKYKIPNNILDYKDDRPIRELFKNGKEEVEDNLELIQYYLKE